MSRAKTVGALNVVGFVAAISITVAANLYEADNIIYAFSLQSLTIGLLMWALLITIGYLMKISTGKPDKVTLIRICVTLNQICTLTVVSMALLMATLTCLALVISIGTGDPWHIVIALAAFLILIRASITLVKDSVTVMRELVRRKKYPGRHHTPHSDRVAHGGR